ncbi:Coenzyme F420 hydrogenase/dehydrogenase, beta subunit C-terminal domain [Micrococcus luteus]|uniref:Coenzyme F420 hydrogenase/dehydrogenase, beta subunit C-terminal domain n=1 Tax=Micrococcus luteus TaxID=1270 RepID=UPI0038792F96
MTRETFLGMPGVPRAERQQGTARDLLMEVVEQDLCIGCGACAALDGSPLEIRLSESGRYRAIAREGADLDQEGAYLRVCPFASQYDEDQLAAGFLGRAQDLRHHDSVGLHRETMAGHVSSEPFRRDGSSGGMTSWFLQRLLDADEVDAVLHVGALAPGEGVTPEGGDLLFGYGVSHTSADVRARAKTRYYPVEMSGVLRHVRENEGRYAVVGLPCFIKAVRLLQAEDPIFDERVRFCVGLVCGHLKSTRFAEAMAWEQGVAPGTLTGIDFRTKTDTDAGSYAISTIDADGTERSRENHRHLVTDWGMGMFKYEACEWCDDVTSETADISFGDAWIAPYAQDPKGANVAVVRSGDAQRVVDAHRDDLQAEPLSADDVARTQDAGLRHRREGLAYRLSRGRTGRRRVPIKRVSPDASVPAWRAEVYDVRERLISEADQAFARTRGSGDFRRFRDAVRPTVWSYQVLYERSAQKRIAGFLQRHAPWLRSAVRAGMRRVRFMRHG